MSYWDYIRNEDASNAKLKKCKTCKQKKAKLVMHSRMGDHPLSDKVWFYARCTRCNARTAEFEGTKADEKATAKWNEIN